MNTDPCWIGTGEYKICGGASGAYIEKANQGTTAVTEPQFIGQMQNVTVAVGEDVTLSCKVDSLGPYMVRTEEQPSKLCRLINKSRGSIRTTIILFRSNG